MALPLFAFASRALSGTVVRALGRHMLRELMDPVAATHRMAVELRNIAADFSGGFKITTNFPEVMRHLDRLHAELKRIPAQALNRVADLGRVEMRRQITAEYNMKVTEVRNMLRTMRARPDGRGGLEAAIYVQPRRGGTRSLNIVRFITNKRAITSAAVRRKLRAGTRKELLVKIKKAGGPKPVKGAFLANADRTAFKRVGPARLPIEPVQTIDVPAMFDARRINDRVRAMIKLRLDAEVDRLTKLAVSRFGRG